MNYLEAIDDRSIEIEVGELAVVVTRARLGRHFVLQAIAAKPGGEKILEYVAEATGLSPTAIGERCTLSELLELFARLFVFNSLTERFPFMSSRNAEDSLDYDGRSLSRIVHLLASAYHWPRDQILELRVEEAFCYVLEILLSSHDNKRFAYTISSSGYDKDGKKLPFPELIWMWPDRRLGGGRRIVVTRQAADRMGLIPAGLIIDLGENRGN